MNREQEAILNRYKQEGKLVDDFVFYVKNKNRNTINPVPGSVISGFLEVEKYEIYEAEPATEDVPKPPKPRASKK